MADDGLPAPFQQIALVPALLGAQVGEIPEVVFKEGWQQSLVHALRVRIAEVGLSLPMLFLTLIEHFIVMLRAESAGSYQPNDYSDLLFLNLRFLKEADGLMRNRPLFIYDPTRTIITLIGSLQTLWRLRHEGLEEMRSFRLNNLNVLEGRSSSGSPWRTVLAHCGGWLQTVSSSKPCGNAPLVFGACKSCECGKLICPECGFCSRNCDLCEPRQKTVRESLGNGSCVPRVRRGSIHGFAGSGTDDEDIGF